MNNFLTKHLGVCARSHRIHLIPECCQNSTSFPAFYTIRLSRAVGTSRREPWKRGWPKLIFFLLALFASIAKPSAEFKRSFALKRDIDGN